MNYASVLFVFFARVSVLWYVVSERKHFAGTPLPSLEEFRKKRMPNNVIGDGEGKDNRC
jgi:hypothetical protein